MSKKTWHSLPSALSIYQKYENNQLQLNDINREDLHFKLKTGADILIEENGIHTYNPFKNKLIDIYNWSLDQNSNVQLVVENYSQWYDNLVNKYTNEIVPTFKQYYGVDNDETLHLNDIDDIEQYCKARIKFLRKTDDSFNAFNEIAHRKQNLFDILWFKRNKNLEDIVLKLYLNELSITNTVTLLQSMYETHENEQGEQTYAHKQRQYSIGEIIELLQTPEINDVSKQNRQLLIPTISGDRIVGENVYLEWSGLQVFDADLKFSSKFVEKWGNDASQCRDILFNKLKKYPWLLGITLSASGRGLHIYTKVSRMHHIFKEDDANIENQKYWYRMSYIQKHAIIAYVLDVHCGITDVYDIVKNGKKTEKIIDSAAAKPSQGIAINYDANAKWSTNFIDLYPVLFYHIPPDEGLSPEDWLLHPKLKIHYTSWFQEWAENDEDNVEITKSLQSLEIQIDDSIQIDNINAIDMENLAKGDKYNTRWRVCNTIMHSFGNTEYARKLCHHILQTTKTKTTGTINSFIRSAVMHRKEADVWTIKQLKSLGVSIGLSEESNIAITDDLLSQTRWTLNENDYNFNVTSPNANIELKDDEYLGMKIPVVLSALKDFKVNVLDSAPNTGKTEFFKELAKSHAICLVIPFTSTIESKIINDESIRSLFDVYFGDISVKDIKKGRSVVMTFDKFSMMPKSKYTMFDFIAIDESHLLFTSTYRLPVVSQTIENIRTYLLDDLNAERTSLSQVLSVQNLMSYMSAEYSEKQHTKFILMTGTTTGELEYFKHYGILNYIKVHKKHPHKKQVDIVLSKTANTRDVLIYQEIAQQLERGGKIIHPTNRGDSYAKQVVECVESILCRKIKWEYYKRANNNDSFLIEVNKNTTVNDIELLFCSDYLSVGIDIKDIKDFKIIFSNDFTAEAVEQFNNRLRSTDIHCKIYYDVINEMGMQKPNIINLNHIEYTHNDELKNMIHDERSIALLQRSIKSNGQYFAILGEMFSKYFIQDHRGEIQYIRSAFEIEQFELQYTIIAKSLLYTKSSMKHRFNYDVNIVIENEKSDEEIDQYMNIRKNAKNAHDKMKSDSFVKLVKYLGSNKIYNISKQNEIEYEQSMILDEMIDFEDGLNLEFDQNLKHGTYKIKYDRSHKLMINFAIKFIKNMRRLYSYETTNEIVKSCLKSNGILNKTELLRYRNLMKLIFDDSRNILSHSTREILETTYEFFDDNSNTTKLDRFEYEELKSTIKFKIEKHFSTITKKALISKRRQDNLNIYVSKYIDTLFHKRITTDYAKLTFRKIYDFDSEIVMQTIERDKIFNRLLMNSKENIVTTTHNIVSEKHYENIEHQKHKAVLVS